MHQLFRDLLDDNRLVTAAAFEMKTLLRRNRLDDHRARPVFCDVRGGQVGYDGVPKLVAQS